jgi:hypothetical protein
MTFTFHEMDFASFDALVRRDKKAFLASIAAPDIYLIRNCFDRAAILSYREKAFEWGMKSEPSWHPCKDGCPDYHRLHDNYPQAYVKAKMHAFYYHGYYEHNAVLFDYFAKIFALKQFLAGKEQHSYIHNIPSSGTIARVNLHHYPKGGGYQQPHVDPAFEFAKIQTIVIASEKGKDYQQGGVYAKRTTDSPEEFVGDDARVGDLLVMSPAIIHGVAPIDEDEPYQWQENTGRWMMMPIIIHSDYHNDPTVKPKGL